jgi:RecA-family ATPase
VTPEVEAITIFNQMDAIAHEKDNFFHQSGKIYTRTGDTLFHKYDTMFHVLDNAYHTAVDTEKKLLRAQRLARFIKIQNELFAATEYVNKEEDKIFNQLDQDFSNAIAKIATNKEMKTSGTGSTGTTITIQ